VFSYAKLKAMPVHEQITTHFCIQGWSGVAKWGGVPMRHILELVRPTSDARCVDRLNPPPEADISRL
jgi:DMSO/TMAO reductase YedYZ molybdopterin-dependent catalytic subunit